MSTRERTRETAPPAASEHERRVVLRKGAHRPTLVRASAPAARPGEALVRTRIAGIDATDEEVVAAEHAELPPGRDEMVLGHECLGEVVHAPEDASVEEGDLVVPLVRHGCGLCPPCRSGVADLCETGRYTEHGIKALDGFLQETWADDPATLVKAPESLDELAVLTEPLSVVVKAVETARRLQRRIPWFEGFQGQRVLLAGTGSLGMLGAFLLVEEGARVYAMDRTGEDAVSSRMLRRLGVEHFNARERSVHDVAEEVGGFHFIVEATGVPRVVFDTVRTLDANGIMCMLGVPAPKDAIPVEADDVMRNMVLRNQVLFGSVNSNRTHFEAAMASLMRFHRRWGSLLEGVITHRFSPEEAEEAFRADDPDLVKKVVTWE